jgi:hypothetical protein
MISLAMNDSDGVDVADRLDAAQGRSPRGST